MTVRNLTPDSFVLHQLDGQWQKFAMLILYKLKGREKVSITLDDIQKLSADFAPEGAVLYTHGHADSIDFQVVDMEAAQRLAAHDATMRGSA